MCARHDVTQAIAEQDFVDHPRKETEAVLQTRKNSNEILNKCGEVYCTPARKAAFALNPRMHHFLSDPDADETLGFPFLEARQALL